jgi:hypothetical protein
MGVAFERFTEALHAHGYKVQAHGRDHARSGCPGHGGQDLNLSIAVGDQGVLLKCHSYDCPAEDIAKGVGLTVEDLFDEDGKATYDYGGGHRVTRKRTRDGKQIYQQHKPKVTALYRHPMSAPIETSDVVVLVEGEKCVDAALRLGEPCVTTWSGGVAGVTHVDLSPLAGKQIRIIADNDEPGLQAGWRLVSRLEGLATVQGVWVAPGEKQGVDDLWLEGGSLAQLEVAPPPPAADIAAEVDERPRKLVLTRLSDVRSRAPRFLWEGVMPLGAVTLWGGRGGVSKSTFALHLAGQITTGTLAGSLFGSPSSVLYVSHEDSLEEVVTLRCAANGVDMDRFHHVAIQSKDMAGHSVPRLPEDMPLIREALEQSGAKVIIIDPVTSTIGGDNDKLLDVRAVMDPLNQLGIELGVSIIAIAHFRKGGGSQSDLISGSGAYRDACRCMMLFARDDEIEGKTVLTVDKSNYGRDGHSFQYVTEIVPIMTDDGAMATAPKINWHGASDKSVGDLINAEQKGSTARRTALRAVMEMADEVPPGVVLRTDEFVSELVPEFSTASIHKALSELKKAGKLLNVSQGLWRKPHEMDDQEPSRAHARVNSPELLHSSTEAGQIRTEPVDNSTDIRTSEGSFEHFDNNSNPFPRARPREDDGRCYICGFPLPDSVIADGGRAHPTCDN